jgi:hypothetical protein
VRSQIVGIVIGSTVKGLELIQKKCSDAHPPDDATISNPDEAAAAYAKVRNCVGDALDQLTGVGVIDHALWMDPGAWWHDWASWRFWLHAVGIVATALALMLAPFWSTSSNVPPAWWGGA